MFESTTLSDGSAETVGLRSEPITRAWGELVAMTAIPDQGYPLYPGVVGLAGHDGTIVTREAAGFAYLFAQPETLAPESERVPMATDTIVDLASVSKLFTSLAAVQLIDQGKLKLDAPVTDYLDGYEINGKQNITVEMLLIHTSGLVPCIPLWSQYETIQQRLDAVIEATPEHQPGTTYQYSDLNLIAVGMIVEKLRGMPLDAVVSNYITGPLGMTETGYNPLSWGVLRDRIAATEWEEPQPGRGLVWGEVHDENAWSLSGVAGHAGVFSTADDLAILAQTLLNGGQYNAQRILSEDAVELMITDFNRDFPGHSHGLGFELDQKWYMAGLAGPRTAGHTGFTGTSIVIDFHTNSFAILLTNRVHPVRSSGSINPARCIWAESLAQAMSVEPTTSPNA